MCEIATGNRHQPNLRSLRDCEAPSEPAQAAGKRYTGWSALAAAFGGGEGHFFAILSRPILRTGPFGAVQKAELGPRNDEQPTGVGSIDEAVE